MHRAAQSGRLPAEKSASQHCRLTISTSLKPTVLDTRLACAQSATEATRDTADKTADTQADPDDDCCCLLHSRNATRQALRVPQEGNKCISMVPWG